MASSKTTHQWQLKLKIGVCTCLLTVVGTLGKFPMYGPSLRPASLLTVIHCVFRSYMLSAFKAANTHTFEQMNRRSTTHNDRRSMSSRLKWWRKTGTTTTLVRCFCKILELDFVNDFISAFISKNLKPKNMNSSSFAIKFMVLTHFCLFLNNKKQKSSISLYFL